MFGRKKNMSRPTKTSVTKRGWTSDSDTEGLFEENLFVALIIGISLLVVAIVGFYIGFDINLQWFQGLNFWSTAGIIILCIFIPAIAISTFTGKSDLIAAEAIFILVGFAMIYMANNWDLSMFTDVFSSNWFNLGDFEFNVSTLMTIVFILAIVVSVIGGIISGHPIGASIVIIFCGFGIFLINSTDPSNIFNEIGESLRGTTEGFLGWDVGHTAATGLTGALAGAAAGALITSWTGPGMGIGAVVGGLLGAAGGMGGGFQGWW